MNFVPKMNPGNLINGYKNIIGKIYSPKYYYERVMTFLREYRPHKLNGISHIEFSDVMALFKSVLKLGIIGKERLYYWKLMLWSIFRRPRLFPMAVMFSIYGFHYRKVFENC